MELSNRWFFHFTTLLALVVLLPQTRLVASFGVAQRQTSFRIPFYSLRAQNAFPVLTRPYTTTTIALRAAAATAAPSSLKPAAVPLMDAGKALARSGEFLIDVTTALDLYGGALSSAGAQIRNAGDSIAQAAASCRFKTGTELVTDELREAATCLLEGVAKLKLAVDEAVTDKDDALANRIEPMVARVESCSLSLESAGAALMQRQSLQVVGKHLIAAGQELAILSKLYAALSDQQQASVSAKDAAQRCLFASEQMILAGTNLLPVDEVSKPKLASGKSWLKGGGG